MFRKYLLSSLSLIFVLALNAHGDLHKRILKVTKEIKIHPDSAYLYFKRGELYFQHNNYNNALADFKRFYKLEDESDDLHFMIAKCNFGLKRYSIGKKFVKKVLKNQPKNPVVIKLLADIYYEQKKFKKSALHYEKVIAYSKETFPENYIDASNAWISLDTKFGYSRAETILKYGIERLGPIYVLYHQMINVLSQIEDFDSAIKLQVKVVEMSKRKERAYLKLASLQIQNKDYNDAEVSFIKAEESFEKLPYGLRNAQFMRAFYSQLQSQKNRLYNKIR